MTDTRRARRGRPPLGPFDLMVARATILQAAAVVYDRAGEDARVEDILREAGISRATFYRHFDSKDALQAALLEVATETLLGAVEGAVREAETAADRIDAGVRAFLGFHAHQPGVYRVLLESALAPGTELHAIRARALDRFAEFLAIEAERTGLAPLEPLVFQALVAAIEGTSVRILTDSPKVDPEVLERARAALVHIISASLGVGASR